MPAWFKPDPLRCKPITDLAYDPEFDADLEYLVLLDDRCSERVLLTFDTITETLGVLRIAGSKRQVDDFDLVHGLDEMKNLVAILQVKIDGESQR